MPAELVSAMHYEVEHDLHTMRTHRLLAGVIQYLAVLRKQVYQALGGKEDIPIPQIADIAPWTVTDEERDMHKQEARRSRTLIAAIATAEGSHGSPRPRQTLPPRGAS